MRLVALLPLLAGCQLVFSLEDTAPDARRRPPFSAQVVDGTKLRVERPATLEPGDFVIGTLQSASFANTLVAMPPGWTSPADFPDGDCDNKQWHVWIVLAQVGDESSFEFELDNPDMFTGLFVPYGGASAVNYLRFETPMNMPLDGEIQFPEVTATSASILYVSEFADQQPAIDPEGMNRVGAFDHIAAFDLAAPEGTVSVPAIPVAANLCAGATLLTVEL